jgi:hypothetical protein
VWNVIKTLFTSPVSYFASEDEMCNTSLKAQTKLTSDDSEKVDIGKSVLSDDESKRKKESTTISFGDLFIR